MGNKPAGLLAAIAKGLRSFFAPGMLGFLLIVPLISMLLWSCLLAFAWTSWQDGLRLWMEGTRLFTWLASMNLSMAGGVSGVMVFIFLLALFVPLSYLTTLMVTAAIVAPRVQSYLLKSHFRDLEKRGGGSFHEGLWNSVVAGFIYVVLFAGAVPLWFVPGGALIVNAILAGWISRRVLVYDLLQGLASDQERERLREENSGSLFLLGFLLGLLSLIPFASLFLPTLATLSYGWFCFDRLRALRGRDPAPSLTE